MTESLARKAIKNAINGFFGWFVPVVISFFTARILVVKIGVEEYGLYSLILGFISYLFIFNTTRAITKHIAASEEKQKPISLISTSLAVNFVFSLVVTSAILIFNEPLIKNLLLIEDKWHQEVKLALYFAAMSVAILFLAQTFIATVLGFQKFEIYSKVNVTAGLLLNLGNIALAFAGYGLIHLVFWNFVANLFSAATFYLAAKRLLQTISFKPSIWAFKEIFKYGASTFGYQLLSNFLFLFERILVTRNYGAESLSYYALAMMVGIQMHFFIASLSQFVFPMTSQIKKEKPEQILNVYTKSIKFAALISLFFTGFFLLEKDEFLSFWLGSDLAKECTAILAFHVLTYFFITIVGVCWQVFDGVGKPQISFLSYGISFPISIASMIYLSSLYNVEGIAIGRLLGTLALFFITVTFEKKAFGKVLLKFWLSLIIKLLFVFSGMLVLKMTLTVLEVSNILVFLLFSSIMFLTMAFAVGLIDIKEIKVITKRG
ncbi:MAG: oligosaccharide flippase family protein [Pyrinomonadaceae bacterium]|nr:oligosaccharide flippase family protein [Pyrinomonadaceae bacterium]MCX7640664.1 oligosaccharide flippase family protein [Pyrinomonadaceae bacterium]MDW8305059.1 oligosaccharide flippase family protein [Acidobacteriota bacterium]